VARAALGRTQCRGERAVSIAAYAIRRPVATVLLTLGFAFAGLVGFKLLPVAPLPQVDFPTIVVQASLPGASPETMAATVATPLERSLGRIAGITEMTSSSSLGSSRVVLQFDLDRDIDGAARDVQASINAARSLLPSGLPSNPTYRKANPADAPIMILALRSATMRQGDMYDWASTVVAQKLSQLKGVGQVNIGGSSLPAVRVELNPTALNKYAVSLEEVRSALSSTNANRPKGSLEKDDRHWQIDANDQAKKAAQYQDLIVAWRDGAPVQLSAVADVVDSVQDVRNAGTVDGQPSVMLVIFRQPNANVIETVDSVRAILPQLQASIPQSLDLSVAMDRTPTIRASLREVEHTLVISIALVIMVVFIFLRNARATFIPSVAVPVSLCGTFGVMYLCGYTIDNLSLMALTVATGFVVDDAIVVLENISRHIEEGMKPFAAALKGAREVGFTVLSMSLSLVAVFIPLLLMGGIVGRLMREFSVVLSVAVLVSLLVSLTVTPMMCARLLRDERQRHHGRFYAASERVFNLLLEHYRRSLGWALRHERIMLMSLLATICLNVYLFSVVPKGFLPQQDTGRLSGFIQGDQSLSFQAMRQKMAKFVEVIRADPAVTRVMEFTSGGGGNGSMFINLKPRAERKENADLIIQRLRKKLGSEPGATIFLQAVQDIRAGGRSSGAQYQYTLQASDLGELHTWVPRIYEALRKLPELSDVNSDLQDAGLQTRVVIDRDTAARLGISVTDVDATLNDAFGQRQVSIIYNPRNQYYVVMGLQPRFTQNAESLRDIYLITANGAQVPLSSVAHIEPTNAPLSVNHQGQFAANTISFNLPQNVSLSQATAAIDETLARIGVPSTIRGSFQGTAKFFQASLASQPWLILGALITIYIVLGMLYESYVHPLTILSTLPSAGVGAVLALLLFKSELSIISLIGIFLLIGIVKKNAIMMIDTALVAERELGMDSREAIHYACLRRFRPILMTTMAAMLGALPLALGSGDGSELRSPLGISIVGGLVVSQMLTLYTTPVVYLYLDRFRLKWQRRWLAFWQRVAPG